MLRSFARTSAVSVIELSESAITSYYVGGMSDGQIIPGLTDGQAAMLRKRAAGGEKKAALVRELGIAGNPCISICVHKSGEQHAGLD